MQSLTMLPNHATIPYPLDPPQFANIRRFDGRRARTSVDQRQLTEGVPVRIIPHLDRVHTRVDHVIVIVLSYTDRDAQLAGLDHVKIVPTIALLDDDFPRGEGARLEHVNDLGQFVLGVITEHDVALDGGVDHLPDGRVLGNRLLDVVVDVFLFVDGVTRSLLDGGEGGIFFVDGRGSVTAFLGGFEVVHELPDASKFLAGVIDGYDVIARERFVGEDVFHQSNHLLIGTSFAALAIHILRRRRHDWSLLLVICGAHCHVLLSGRFSNHHEVW
mmetsp:Transcript_1451/g.2558  ORF Transcript_1451/g.2558 Transcript_1451/m.2558 type:complete len:273 (-) Transcript_1451:65-883(-)